MNKTAGRNGPDEIRRAKLIVHEARESKGVVLPEPTTPGEAALIVKEYEFGARGLALNHQAFPWAILGGGSSSCNAGPYTVVADGQQCDTRFHFTLFPAKTAWPRFPPVEIFMESGEVRYFGCSLDLKKHQRETYLKLIEQAQQRRRTVTTPRILKTLDGIDASQLEQYLCRVRKAFKDVAMRLPEVSDRKPAEDLADIIVPFRKSGGYSFERPELFIVHAPR